MSCSLKLHKDNLEDLDIISKFSTIKDKSKLIKYGKATMNAYNEKHGMVDHIGNPFFVNYIGKGKEKVVFNKIFFEAIDQLENAVFFKENALKESVYKEENVVLENNDSIEYISDEEILSKLISMNIETENGQEEIEMTFGEAQDYIKSNLDAIEELKKCMS
jgi:tetrahydromethanopterin S-methyltransferase subunit H